MLALKNAIRGARLQCTDLGPIFDYVVCSVGHLQEFTGCRLGNLTNLLMLTNCRFIERANPCMLDLSSTPR
ncbi:hypothetical protein HPP92_015941 [Vanilla planifolia]|uniref:Uncharacterized protein n=1 Tax=Vanilla planifolia TaxID=51239 RepID=A0A835QDW1_VANPL|nr:hypothetical protein HPP92_015941 [Vanilla planifolia]